MKESLADKVRARLRRLLGYVTGENATLSQRADDFLPHVLRPPQFPAGQPAEDGLTDDDFDTLLREGRIRTEYQPIVSLADGSVIGYEALSRGPIGTRLESANALFEAARRRGVGPVLERLCRFRALSGAASLPPGCSLFLNISPNVLEERHGGLTHDVLEQHHLPSERIVLEITEKEAIADFDFFKRTLLHYSRQGFKIAIDDAGAGHNSLHAVTEIRPHYIKLDMALVRDIDRDRAKNALVAAIIMFARRIDARVLAEGVETVEELATLIEIGVDYGQGHVLARPAPAFVEPKAEVAAFIRERATASRVVAAPTRMAVNTITRRAPALMPTAYTGEVLEIFERNPDLDSVVLTEYGAPVGLVSRTKLYERLSRQFGYSIYAKRPVRLVMDDAYLSVDSKDSIDEVARKVVHRRRTEIYDEVIVLENGVYSGVVSVRDLLHTMTEFQASVNRYSNPLTGLPGRTLVQQEIERRANSGAPYALLHVDINHFRTYNERHGYGRGDEVIKALAECLVTVTKEVEGPQGLVGHLGGVNFIVVGSERTVEAMGIAIIERFERRAAALHIQREVSLLGADVRTAPPEIELAIAGVSASVASSNGGGLAARAAQYKRMARTMRGSAFVLDGRTIAGSREGNAIRRA